jgi:holliday junction DNA helicase RuvA
VIGFLRGRLVAKRAPSLVLDVHGVGYEVDAPMSTFFNLPAVGEELMLHTHLVVREDAHALFGFLSEAERSLFRSLIRVSGVGAKLALAILSGVSAEEFRRCVHHNDTATLVRLPGVGKKTAERLIIEMRDRLPAGQGATMPGLEMPRGFDPLSPTDEAVSALIALGYKPLEAERMIRGVAAEGRSAEDLIRQALQGAAKS